MRPGCGASNDAAAATSPLVPVVAVVLVDDRVPSMIALSTISMSVIDSVSAAKARRAAAANASPEASRGRSVREYPNTKARATERSMVGTSSQPRAVPITMPNTSPMAQPVRQWSVALKAS